MARYLWGILVILMLVFLFLSERGQQSPIPGDHSTKNTTLVLNPIEADIDFRAEHTPVLQAPSLDHLDVALDSSQAEPTPQPQTDLAMILDDTRWAILEVHDWPQRAGDDLAVWVSVPEQRLRVLRGRAVLYDTPCATAKNGVGADADSLKTPLGWHRVAEKIGAGAPWGQVFRSRTPTHEIWRPGGDTAEDLVLTRILWLDGLEPGKNKGGNVDSYDRYIYIHGTNDEANIGTPSSHGCVRLTNHDVIAVFDLVPQGAPVLITNQ